MENITSTIQLPTPTQRNLFLSKEVSADSMLELTKRILEINSEDLYFENLYKIHGQDYKRNPINIYIDSPGGCVYSCFGLLSIMDSSKTPIHTYVTGSAMSAGFMILIHGSKRFGYKNSTLMYHQASTGFWGKVKDMEADYEETKRLQNKIESMVLDKTKITKKKLKEIYNSKHDWYIGSLEAIKWGIIDEIV
jgi:ATP-dependent Clp protease protease subunit